MNDHASGQPAQPLCLRMRLSRLPPVGVVELLRASPGNRQRTPLVAGMDSRHLNDLPDVVASVAQRSFDGQRHGMRFSADLDGLFEVFRFQVLERAEQARPATFPCLQDFGPAAEAIDEFVITVSPWFLAVGRQKISPAGGKVAGDVLHDHRDGIRVRIEGNTELVVGHLLDSSIRQSLIRLKCIDDRGEKPGSNVHDLIPVSLQHIQRIDVDDPLHVVGRLDFGGCRFDGGADGVGVVALHL